MFVQSFVHQGPGVLFGDRGLHTFEIAGPAVQDVPGGIEHEVRDGDIDEVDDGARVVLGQFNAAPGETDGDQDGEEGSNGIVVN